MIYPEFLKEHDTIGVTAPSDGITDKVKLKRLDNAIKNFEEKGLIIKETPNVRCSFKGRSSSSKERADELESLYKDDNVKVINQDVLQANLPELIKKEFKDPSRPIKVVANLPYYITSPILMNLLASPVEWATICVMMQKEVAQRLTAKPGTKQYGALTLAIEYQMQAKIAFDVSRKVFVPSPNVDSAIVVLTPRTNPLPVQPFDKQKLFGFIRGCFAHRRKSLWNNLQSVIGKDPAVKEKMTAVLAQLDISPQIRPEKLTLEQFIELTNALHQQNLL